MNNNVKQPHKTSRFAHLLESAAIVLLAALAAYAAAA
jgi:hypothetical protein